MSHFSYSQGFEGLPDIFLRDAPHYLPLVQFINQVMTRDSELSHAQRETIAAYVSAQNQCNYCVETHSSVLDALGEDRTVTDSIANESIDLIDPKMQSLLDLAEKISVSPYKITEADIKNAQKTGWSEQAIEDAINVMCVFEFVNRTVDAFGIKGSKSHFSQIGGMAAQHGYAPLVEMVQQKAKQE